MPGQFFSPTGEDLERIYVDDYALVDEYAQSGSLWTWGDNQLGDLAINNTLARSSPGQTISGGTNWKSIADGGGAFIGIKSDGTLWTWGSGSGGLLGNNANTNRSSPVQTVSTGNNWKVVDNRLAIKTDGTLWTWGSNGSGQLGINSTANRSSPVQTVSTGTNWASVGTGASGGQACAIKTDGTLWVWGNNDYGQLGTNDFTPRSSPVQTIAGGNNWKQVATGFLNSAAVKTDGTLWVWGNNALGQIGDNTRDQRLSPVQTIFNTTNWKQVSAGDRFTASIKTDGTLWLWGYNNKGQLGTGVTLPPKSSPVQIFGGGTNWKNVSCGYDHVTAVKTDGTLWVWGSSDFGQLGTGSTVNRATRIETESGGNNWKQSASGTYTSAAIHFYDAGNLYPSA